MQTQLRSRLLADATVSAQCATRVDWNVRPQAKGLPAVTLTLVSDRREQHMSGLQATRGTWVQADVWAVTVATAVTIREAIVSLFAAAAVQSGVRFLGADDINVRDNVERTEDGQVIHRSMIQAIIWHTT